MSHDTEEYNPREERIENKSKGRQNKLKISTGKNSRK